MWSMFPIALGALLLLPASAQAQQCVPAPADLISWWPADGNAVDVEDGNGGALQNGATFAAGKVDQAFALDGVDDFVEIANSTNLNFGGSDFSIDGWFRVDGAPADFGGIVSKRVGVFGAADVGYQVYYINQLGNPGFRKVQAAASDGTTIMVLDGATIVDDGQFHHFAFVREGTAFRLYVDAGIDQVGSGALGSLDNTLEFRIGSRAGTTVIDSLFSPFQGVIDEVEVFDRALTTAEIQVIFDAGTAGKCKDEDGDGFRPPQDCDETDQAINPDATELPGNFVDENCNGDLGDCDPCFAWKNHGHYVRCVAHAAEGLVAGGDITQEVADELVSSAARSDLGKKEFVPAECQ